MTRYKFLILTSICAALCLAACGDKDHGHDTDHQAVAHEKGHHSQSATDHDKHDAADKSHDGYDIHDDHNADDHDDHQRQAGSHVHGDATLLMALDGDVLVIELESPLYNLLGFEHAPKTELQGKTLERAEVTLGMPENLFVLNNEAACAVEPSKNIHLLDGHDEGGRGDHKDALLEYHFTCASPNKLRSLTVNLFDHFPQMGELETVYLGPGIQTQADLTANNKTMKLTK